MDQGIFSPKAPARRPRVFLSYSRADREIVDLLYAALSARYVEPIIDRRDIEKFEDWWNRIQQLIMSADVFAFVLTPDSIKSEICVREVEFAGGSISVSLLF